MLLQRAFDARRNHCLDDAHRDATEAVRICRQRGTQLDLATALTFLGQIERDLGHAPVALGHYQEAAFIYREQGSALRLAHAVRHAGDIYRHQKNLDCARKSYEEALEIYRSHPDTSPLDLANAIRGYALLLEDSREFAAASSRWQEARQLYAQVDVQAGVTESSERLKALAES